MKALLDANGEAVSGQQLADRLGVSRTAIWKHMQALQEQGFAFVAVHDLSLRMQSHFF